jgi:uncharacterized protein YbjT (DUF2867 family)
MEAPEISQRTVLVTGATGRQGGAVARALLASGLPVKATTRKPASPPAQSPAKQGVEIIRAGFDDAASMECALSGVWGVWVVLNRWEAGGDREEEQGRHTAQIARQRGVQHFDQTSFASAHRKTGIHHIENTEIAAWRSASAGSASTSSPRWDAEFEAASRRWATNGNGDPVPIC